MLRTENKVMRKKYFCLRLESIEETLYEVSKSYNRCMYTAPQNYKGESFQNFHKDTEKLCKAFFVYKQSYILSP